jgi:hypothetical protein
MREDDAGGDGRRCSRRGRKKFLYVRDINQMNSQVEIYFNTV